MHSHPPVYRPVARLLPSRVLSSPSRQGEEALTYKQWKHLPSPGYIITKTIAP